MDKPVLPCTTRFAKTDLHLHLDGSLTPQTMLEAARLCHITLPAHTIQALMPYITVPKECHSLATYLSCFALPLTLLQTAQTLTLATRDLLLRLAQEGLEYAEIRFAPQLHTTQGLSQEAAIEAVLQAVSAHATLPRVGIILCMMTSGTHAQNAQTAQLAIAYHAQGVCGLDLAGQEGIAPMHNFAPLYAKAIEHGVGATLHAGEACGAHSVAQALDLGVTRIGHGTRVIEDEAVLERVIAQGVTLEQCITSNVQTHCVPSLQAHPIQKLLARGVHIALCTDNRTVSHTTLAQEYDLLQTQLGFSDAACQSIATYAKQAAFIK